MEQYTFRQPVDVTKCISLNDSYDIPRYKWLRKLLKRLGWLKQSYYMHHFSTYETFTISAPRLRGLIQQFMHQIQRTTYQSPTKIYVGEMGYRQLMEDFRKELLCTEVSWPVKVYGAEIIFTPFLDGVEFLPVFD